MARTSRGSAAAAPAMDAGALDDLDLDDMFAEDGDTLFEGLDIQLEGMGDIISDEQKEQKEQKEPTPKSGSGPKTKKSNLVAAEAPAEAAVPKRRKTKRKSKAPTAFGDDDDDYVEDVQPKKKQRKAAANRKAPGAKAAAAPASSSSQTKKKRTKKGDSSTADKISSPSSKTKKTSASVPASGGISRSSSATVAAAGRFGERLKRGSSLPTNKSKRKKGLPPTSSQAGGSAGQTAKTPLPEASPPPPPINPPQLEPTYGGLIPSKTHFYPFMESVPTEPSMKNRKVYPSLDRVFTSLNSQMNEKDAPAGQAKDVTTDSAIYKLLVETYEGGNEKERVGFTPEKRMTLLHSIPKLRDGIDKMEKQKLVHDLFAMCGLLARQHSFLTQSLANMKDWCKTEFTPHDYNATYARNVAKEVASLGHFAGAKPVTTKWPRALIKVKIVFSSYKEPKGATPLTAILPSNVVAAPPTKPAPASAPATKPAPAPAPTSKKRKKEKTTEKLKSTPAAAPAPLPVPTIKPYSQCKPVERRKRITDAVSQLALQLEAEELKTQHRQKPPEALPDEEPPLHTARMWQWLDSVGYYDRFPANGLDMCAPEIHPRGLFLANPTKIQGHDDRVYEISSNSLFDRMQSLLVEADGSDGQNADDLTDGGEDSDEESLGFLDEEEASSSVESTEMADISNLSIEERAFVFLRSVGLIEESVFPMVELVLSSNEEEKKIRAEDDLVNVIGKMSNDLADLTSRNNGRFSFLESALSSSDSLSNKQTEEDRASIIARCQSLLRRNKEKVKKIKQKKDDSLNLPW